MKHENSGQLLTVCVCACVCGVCVAIFASAFVIAVDQSEVTTSIHVGEWAGSGIPLVLPLLPQVGEDEAARHLLAAMRRHTHRQRRLVLCLRGRCQFTPMTIIACN